MTAEKQEAYVATYKFFKIVRRLGLASTPNNKLESWNSVRDFLRKHHDRFMAEDV